MLPAANNRSSLGDECSCRFQLFSFVVEHVVNRMAVTVSLRWTHTGGQGVGGWTGESITVHYIY